MNVEKWLVREIYTVVKRFLINVSFAKFSMPLSHSTASVKNDTQTTFFSEVEPILSFKLVHIHHNYQQDSSISIPIHWAPVTTPTISKAIADLFLKANRFP